MQPQDLINDGYNEINTYQFDVNHQIVTYAKGNDRKFIPYYRKRSKRISSWLLYVTGPELTDGHYTWRASVILNSFPDACHFLVVKTRTRNVSKAA